MHLLLEKVATERKTVEFEKLLNGKNRKYCTSDVTRYEVIYVFTRTYEIMKKGY